MRDEDVEKVWIWNDEKKNLFAAGNLLDGGYFCLFRKECGSVDAGQYVDRDFVWSFDRAELCGYGFTDAGFVCGYG